MSAPVSTAALDRLVAQVGELYSLPCVAVEVLELTRQPAVDLWKLKQCIEQDPALTAKLLRVVNSALFGLTRSVTDLNQALAILGTKPLKLLVLGFSLPEGVFHNLAGDFLSGYWQRTLIKAVAARELSGFVAKASSDEAFIAALLQDIGTLVLLQHLGQDYAALLEAAEDSRGGTLLLERRTLGFDHTQLSARLLSRWQLPEVIVAAAELPHSPDEIQGDDPRQALRWIVYLADLLSRVLLDSDSEALQELLEASRAGTTLDEPQLARLVDEMQAKVPQLAGVLSLKLPENVNYKELLTRAYAQLAPLAGDAAAELIGVRRLAAIRQAEAISEEPTSEPALRIADRPVAVSAAKRPSAVISLEEIACDNRQLVSSLSSAIGACRQRRVPLSLLLVQIDGEDDSTQEVDAAEELNILCYALDHTEVRCHKLSTSCIAVVLASCERQHAVRLGQQLLTDWRQFTSTVPAASDMTLSIGLAAVALPSRNFPARELISSAARCLSGAQSSGGNCLKSIEL